jgi:hypothetical protein
MTQRFSARLACVLTVAGCAAGDDATLPPTETTSTTTSALDGVCGSEPKLPPFGSSFRILSFNTQLLSPWFSMPSPDFGLPSDAIMHEKAEKIAAILRQGKFDVIGLNEVWDEDDGKDVLVNKLCPTYPNFVRSVDGSGITEERPEDAGLMVFSKLAFAPLPNGSFIGTDTESSLGNNSTRIAYSRFSDCSGIDCFASKGALMVRLLHPASQRILDFVTTHMQANGGEETVRKAQMELIRGRCEQGIASLPNLITSTLGLGLGALQGLCAWPNSEWVAVTGDHNIRGEGAVRASVHPGTAVPAAGPAEWESQIGTFSDAVATNRWALTDPWAETTSPLDVGLTHRASGERLDYILTSRRTVVPAGTVPPPDMCVQYVWNPPELHGLSDHEPLAADLNLMAPQCNPRLAYVVKPTDVTFPGISKAAKKLDRDLRFPGSMQWFRVDEPGTYAIAVTAGLSFERFDLDDLSTPLGGSTDLGSDLIQSCTPSAAGAPQCSRQNATKIVSTAPFFLRVFSTNRAFVGTYSATIYKYKCNTPAEACEVLPNAPQPFNFPAAGTVLAPNDTAWFKVTIREQADSGAAQSLRFHADNTAAGAWAPPKIAVFDSTGTTQLGAIDGNPISGTGSMTNPAGKERVFRTSKATVNQTVLLRVVRPNFMNNLTLKAGWQTDLTLVGALGTQGAVLTCEDETNPEVGSDEIRMRARVDGTWQDAGAADYDCNDSELSRNWAGNFGVKRVLSGVDIRVLEEDDFLAGGDDLANAFPVDMIPLESEVSGLIDNTIHWGFSDGDYRFEFQTGKWRE